MIVIDASALADALVAPAERGEWARAQLLAADSRHAPHLIDYEVVTVIRRHVARRGLSARRGLEALADLESVAMRRYPAGPLLARIWSLRAVMTAYDAAYVALAEALDCPLVTTDGRLARSHGHGAVVVAP